MKRDHPVAKQRHVDAAADNGTIHHDGAIVGVIARPVKQRAFGGVGRLPFFISLADIIKPCHQILADVILAVAAGNGGLRQRDYHALVVLPHAGRLTQNEGIARALIHFIADRAFKGQPQAGGGVGLIREGELGAGGRRGHIDGVERNGA